jgi:hypothetical protein
LLVAQFMVAEAEAQVFMELVELVELVVEGKAETGAQPVLQSAVQQEVVVVEKLMVTPLAMAVQA